MAGRVNLSLLEETGNTKKEVVNLDGEIIGRTERARLIGRVDLAFEDAAGVITENRATGTLAFDRFVTDKIFVFASGGFEYDDLKRLNFRAVISAGPGYQFYEGDERNLAVRAGPAYMHESFVGDARNTNAPAFAASLEFDQFLFDRFVQVFWIPLGFVNLDEPSRAVIRSSVGLRFPIRRGFVATIRHDIQYETEPLAGRSRTDNTYRFSLGYEWQ